MARTRRTANPKPEPPTLHIDISLKPDGTVEIDPQYNKAAVEHFDNLYDMAGVDEYDRQWTDDHKIAFFLYDMIEQVLAQWGPPIDQAEVEDSVPNVPHIKDAPVRDVLDIRRMNSLSRPNSRRG